MPNENIKVSIIIPVYNIPETILRKCIESAMHQTLQEIEIILVDDGSTDHTSAKVCDEMAVQDKRVIVIHKKNGGLAAARNTGYEAAHGEWITFVDSDDYLSPSICELCYQKGTMTNSDVVIFGTVQEFGNHKHPFTYHYQDGQLFEGDQCKKLQEEILDFTGNIATAWAKLIRRNFLLEYGIEHDGQLRQGSEGIEFNIRMFEYVQRALFLSEIGYHYVYNPCSISAKHDELNHFFVLRCFEAIGKQIQQSDNREKLQKIYYKRIAYILISAAITGYFSPLNKQSYSEKKNSYKNYLSHPLLQTCLKQDLTSLDIKRRFILWCIRHKCFAVLSILARIRYFEKHRK